DAHMRASRKETALWLLDDLVPGSGANNLSLAFRVAGRLDPTALAAALDLLPRRYEVLRTVFHRTDDALTRTILPSIGIEPEQAAGHGDERGTLTAFVARPFRADGSPLLRALLLHGPDEDVFCLALHHAIADVQSTALLRAQLVE